MVHIFETFHEGGTTRGGCEPCLSTFVGFGCRYEHASCEEASAGVWIVIVTIEDVPRDRRGVSADRPMRAGGRTNVQGRRVEANRPATLVEFSDEALSDNVCDFGTWYCMKSLDADQ